MNLNNYLILSLIVYMLLNTFFYFRVSKLNLSYINSYSLKVSVMVLIQILPFIIFISKNNVGNRYTFDTVNAFLLSIFLSSYFGYFGYRIGFKKQIKSTFLETEVSKLGINILYTASFFIAILSFVALGVKGVGVTQWIINNRYAYLVGRNGLGSYYVLYQLMLVVMLVCTLLKRNNKLAKISNILFVIILAYFTGSKSFLLGAIISIVFYYDLAVKQIKLKNIIMLGFFIVISVQALLMVQSNVNIYEYGGSDYYNNYIMLVDSIDKDEFTYYHGKLNLEEGFWHLIPRGIYSQKPYVYGQSRIVAYFYGEQTVIRGSTPSFTPLAVPYADFGLLGVIVIFYFNGMITGLVENTLRNYIKETKTALIPLFLYIIIFFLTPSNLSNLHLFVIILLLILFISIFHSRKRLRKTTMEGKSNDL